MARAKETARKVPSSTRRSARLSAPAVPVVKPKMKVKPEPKSKKIVRHHKLLRPDENVSNRNIEM